MSELITNRRTSRITDLDRKMVRELCDLHPLDMSQLCAKVGLNKTAFSNFLTGRRPLPEKFAPQFLRQIGLTVKGGIDSRHLFYFAVGPGLEDLAAKWIGRLLPNGGNMWTIIQYVLMHEHEIEHENFPFESYELGVVLLGDDHAVIVRDDVNFGNFSWIPGFWKKRGSLEGKALLDTVNLPTFDTISIAMKSGEHSEQEISWAEVQIFAGENGFTAEDVLQHLRTALRMRSRT